MTTPGADAFFAAVDAGDAGAVVSLLRDRPALADARDDGDVSAVRHALYRGRGEVAALIARVATTLDGFDLAAVGDVARLRDHVRTHPDAARAFSEDGFTALHFAAFLGGAETAQVLLDAGADVNATARNAMQVQPLHSAAAGRREVVAVLLAAGADVNARQQGGFTALHEAALNGNDALVDALLGASADPSLRDDEGRNAADHAERNGHGALARRLRQDA